MRSGARSAASASTSVSGGGPSTPRRAGRVIAAAIVTSGRIAQNTNRHEVACSMPLAIVGPMSPGITQALENTANTRGRIAGG
jgi:hypothetical protein